MNQFVTTALALSAAGSLAAAGPGADSEWSGLDSQLKTIRSSYQGDPVASVGGVVGTTFLWVEEEARAFHQIGVDDDDALGFRLHVADAWLEGAVGEFDWRISFDGSELADFGSDTGSGSGVVSIDEAFADWNFEQGVFRMGRFLQTVYRWAGYAPENMLFIEPPLIGLAFEGELRDVGAEFAGNAGALDYIVGIQNSDDGLSDEFNIGARAQWNLNEGVGEIEGAYGAPQDTVGTVGIFWHDQGDQDAGDVVGIDAAFTFGPFSAGASIVDTDFDADASGDGVEISFGETTPWHVQGSYLLNEDLELALRYEDLDTDSDFTRITAGVNYYQVGHNSMWQFNVGQDDSDVGDGTFAAVAWVLGDSGNYIDPGSGRRR